MLRVRELAATGMERSSVKTGMTEERAWRPDIETGGTGMTKAGHGDRT